LTKLNFLAAFPYLEKSKGFLRRLAAHQNEICAFVDSGAFTAWTLGKEIKLDDYCRFLDGLPFAPWRALTLDVIGNAEATMANFLEMRRRGFSPVPIFTRGESLDALEDYFGHSDIVALGGVAGANNSSAAWCKAVMPVIGQRRAHILGMTRTEWVKFFRPFSVDSSSWMGAARFGTIALYMGDGRMEVLRPRALEGRLPAPVASRIRRYGFDPYGLRKPRAGVGAWSTWQLISTHSWVEFAIDCQAAIGTKVFLAAATEQYFEQLVEVFGRIQEIKQGKESPQCARYSAQ
jgi:hypothetical protein